MDIIVQGLVFPADFESTGPHLLCFSEHLFHSGTELRKFWLTITSINATFPCEVLPSTACPSPPVDLLGDLSGSIGIVGAGEVRGSRNFQLMLFTISWIW